MIKSRRGKDWCGIAPGRGAFGLLLAFCLSLVLVYGMVASPLMVECIPNGGSPLVELIGQDPCHHLVLDTGTRSADDPSANFKSGDSGDPCVDLVLDRFGVTQSGIDVRAPSVSATPQLPAALVPAEHPVCVPIPRLVFKFAREPVMVSSWNSRSTLPLRI